jgi:hypothetical protein
MIDYLLSNLDFKVAALDPATKIIKKMADNYLIFILIFFLNFLIYFINIIKKICSYIIFFMLTLL